MVEGCIASIYDRFAPHQHVQEVTRTTEQSAMHAGSAPDSSGGGRRQMSALSGQRNKWPSPRSTRTRLLALALVALLSCCSKRQTKVAAGNTTQKEFVSPAAAAAALVLAAKAGDPNAMMAILGPGGKDILFSGDAVEDKNTMEQFVDAYSQMNRWSNRRSGDEILHMGADNSAFSLPLIQNAPGHWAFNSSAGKTKILARRIVDDELAAIGVLAEIVIAQQEYFNQAHEFAKQLVSTENGQNGLYWSVTQGERGSPLDRLAQEAKANGYSQFENRRPLNGYYYKILMQQGNAAKGGTRYYLTDGKLLDGFAVVAWPAKYGNSGIMTFIVNKDGTIYKRDFGADTSAMIDELGVYNPGEGWTVAKTVEPHKAAVDTQNQELAESHKTHAESQSSEPTIESHEVPGDSQSPEPAVESHKASGDSQSSEPAIESHEPTGDSQSSEPAPESQKATGDSQSPRP